MLKGASWHKTAARASRENVDSWWSLLTNLIFSVFWYLQMYSELHQDTIWCWMPPSAHCPHTCIPNKKPFAESELFSQALLCILAIQISGIHKKIQIIIIFLSFCISSCLRTLIASISRVRVTETSNCWELPACFSIFHYLLQLYFRTSMSIIWNFCFCRIKDNFRSVVTWGELWNWGLEKNDAKCNFYLDTVFEAFLWSSKKVLK